MNKYEIIRKLKNQYASEAARRENLIEARKDELRGLPEYAAAENALTGLYFDLASCDEGDKPRIAELKKGIAAQNKKIAAVLKKHKLPEDWLTPAPACEKCGDSGVRDGQYCDCFKKKYLEALKEACGLKYKADFTFSDCDLSVFKNAEHKKRIGEMYRLMKEYCKKFPEVRYKNILITGGTGVGKSCLASAICNELISRGYSALFLTAFEFNALMLKYHTSPSRERDGLMDDILECDFLVLDDLGTEPLIRNVTAEYLYYVVSLRQNGGKHTMYSTNLDLESLLARYGERLFSRITNKENTLCRRIEGDDVRLR